MEKTRSGEYVSSQVADFGVMDISAQDFSLSGGQKFQVKNEGSDAVTLEVIPASAVSGETEFHRRACFEMGVLIL